MNSATNMSPFLAHTMCDNPSTHTETLSTSTQGNDTTSNPQHIDAFQALQNLQTVNSSNNLNTQDYPILQALQDLQPDDAMKLLEMLVPLPTPTGNNLPPASIAASAPSSGSGVPDSFSYFPKQVKDNLLPILDSNISSGSLNTAIPPTVSNKLYDFKPSIEFPKDSQTPVDDVINLGSLDRISTFGSDSLNNNNSFSQVLMPYNPVTSLPGGITYEISGDPNNYRERTTSDSSIVSNESSTRPSVLSNQLALTRTNNTESKKIVPAFLNKLFNMIEDSSNFELICWSDDGLEFIVKNPDELARSVLPKFFKHNNFSSFVRQLNMYGFHKVPHITQGALEYTQEANMWRFSNPNFQRDRPDLLINVSRKKRDDKDTTQNNEINVNQDQGTVSNQDYQKLLKEFSQLKSEQSKLIRSISSMKTDFSKALFMEIDTLRKQYNRQQMTITHILQFLASFFTPDKALNGQFSNLNALSNPFGNQDANSAFSRVNSNALALTGPSKFRIPPAIPGLSNPTLSTVPLASFDALDGSSSNTHDFNNLFNESIIGGADNTTQSSFLGNIINSNSAITNTIPNTNSGEESQLEDEINLSTLPTESQPPSPKSTFTKSILETPANRTRSKKRKFDQQEVSENKTKTKSRHK